MQKLLLVYNPVAGAGEFGGWLDECIEVLQDGGYLVSAYRTTGNIGDLFVQNAAKDYDVVAVAGGDGTINRVVNAMAKNGIEVPIGIIAAGTANDLARHIGVADGFLEACKAITKGTVQPMDLGMINDDYFVNVCAGGLFSNVSHNTHQDLKNTLGRLAYYIKGMEQLQNPSPLKIRLQTSSEAIEDELMLFLVLNSARLGGLGDVCPPAEIDDGLFDFVGFRNISLLDIPSLVIKILSRDYLGDKRILFRRDGYFRIELAETPKNSEFILTDVDGEPGPKMPITIRNLPKALRIISPVQKGTT